MREVRVLCGGNTGQRVTPVPLELGVLPHLDNSIRNLPMGSPCDPAIPLLGIHPKEIMGQESKDVCTRMFMAAELVTTKDWTQLKGLSIQNLLNKFC